MEKIAKKEKLLNIFEESLKENEKIKLLLESKEYFYNEKGDEIKQGYERMAFNMVEELQFYMMINQINNDLIFNLTDCKSGMYDFEPDVYSYKKQIVSAKLLEEIKEIEL